MGWSASLLMACIVISPIFLCWPGKRNPRNERTYGVLPPASEKCKRIYPT